MISLTFRRIKLKSLIKNLLLIFHNSFFTIVSGITLYIMCFLHPFFKKIMIILHQMNKK